MRNQKINVSGLVFILLLLPVAMGHAASKKGSLGSSSSATDYYRVTCSTNANGATSSLNVKITDLAPAATPMLSAQVIKGIKAKNTTDAKDGDTTASPAAIVQGGDGVYEVRVNKTEGGAELYTLSYSCINSAGKATGVSIATVQNQ